MGQSSPMSLHRSIDPLQGPLALELFRSSPEPQLVYPRQGSQFGTLALANRAAETLLESAGIGLPDRSLTDLFELEDTSLSLLGDLDSALPPLLRLPARLRRGGGEVALEANLVRTSERDWLVVKIQSPESIDGHQAGLLESLRMAQTSCRERSEFLSDLGHDIRTPLNAVIGFGDLLAGMDLPSIQRGYVDSIRSSGRSLLQLLNDLLDLSRLEAGRLTLQPARISLPVLASEVLRANQAAGHQAGVRFRSTLGPEANASIHCDEARLKQILTNLVAHLVHAGSTEEISVSVDVLPGTLPGTRDLRVLVQGEGKPRPSTSNRGSGSQAAPELRFALARSLIEWMGGRLKREDLPDGTGKLLFLLPGISIAKNPSAGMPSGSARSTTPRLEGKVLVADDVEVNQLLMQGMLEQLGCETILASDGQEALDLARMHRPRLVLMDLRMPRMDGFEATRRMKSDPLLAPIPVVALTASVDPFDLPAIQEAGFHAALEKPIAMDLLLDLLGGLFSSATTGQTVASATPPKVPTKSKAAVGQALERFRASSGSGIRFPALQALCRELAELASGEPALEELVAPLTEATATFDMPTIEHILHLFGNPEGDP